MNPPLLPVVVPPTENLAEVTGLSSALQRSDHIRVYPGKWRWTEDDQWPPLQAVLQTQFWSSEDYKPVREGLREAVPNPEVIVGGEFVTVDIHVQRVAAPPATQELQPAQPAEEPKDLGTEIIDEGQPMPPQPAVSQRPLVSEAAPSQPEPSQQRKSGLIHLVGMRVGSLVPEGLRDLNYRLVLIEATEEDPHMEAHSLAARVLDTSQDVIIAVIGSPLRSNEVASSIQKLISREQLKMCHMTIHTPSNVTQPWLFDQHHLVLISRRHFHFRVCIWFLLCAAGLVGCFGGFWKCGWIHSLSRVLFLLPVFFPVSHSCPDRSPGVSRRSSTCARQRSLGGFCERWMPMRGAGCCCCLGMSPWRVDWRSEDPLE